MDKVRFRYRHWLFRLPLLRHYRAICLGRTVYFKLAEEEIAPELLRHEMAHQAQITRDGLVRFYVTYLADYARNLVRYRNHWEAYKQIGYEVEARGKEKSSI
jgi:hypothetical protein